MTKPILDKAEVALEYPDKFYSGTFERSSLFEASFDLKGVALVLERTGSQDVRKSVHIHMHYGLLADVIEQLAATAHAIPRDDVAYEHLARAVRALEEAIGSR